MALINLSYMAEFVVFFTKLSPATLRQRIFSYGSRFLKNLSKEVLVLNNTRIFNDYTACFKIRVPPSIAYMKIYEVFFM